MFRARFNSAFPKSIPQFGPQDIERGVVNTLPDEGVEKLLCALIGLVLNRKKDVESVTLPLNNSHSCFSTKTYYTIAGEVIILEHSKKRYSQTRTNGHQRGKTRILFMEEVTSII